MTSRKSAIAVLIAAFLSGCLLGASGFWFWRTMNQSAPYANDMHGRYDYSVRIFDRLQLTSEQKNRLQEILEESRRRINDCRSEMQDRMNGIRVQTNEKIASTLDENQRSMFEDLLQEAELRTGGGHHDRGRRSQSH